MEAHKKFEDEEAAKKLEADEEQATRIATCQKYRDSPQDARGPDGSYGARPAVGAWHGSPGDSAARESNDATLSLESSSHGPVSICSAYLLDLHLALNDQPSVIFSASSRSTTKRHRPRCHHRKPRAGKHLHDDVRARHAASLAFIDMVLI